AAAARQGFRHGVASFLELVCLERAADAGPSEAPGERVAENRLRHGRKGEVTDPPGGPVHQVDSGWALSAGQCPPEVIEPFGRQ
ncbi:hypothetical protein ACWDRR_03630, partial [Kitasatospora sp. NPDC003701]